MTLTSLIETFISPLLAVETNARSYTYQRNVTPLNSHPLYFNAESAVNQLKGCPNQALNSLLPNLGRLTRQRKWVILVAPPSAPDSHALARAGIDSRRYLVINAKSEEGKWWAVEQALRSGNCGAVVCWADSLSRQQNHRLEQAAEEGGALCFCLQEPAPLPPAALMFQAA
jgi:cell division inhibitor SulA